MAAADRLKRLDALSTATTEWVDRRTKELKENVASAKLILKGRTGSERLASQTTQAASDLVVNAISDFLAT
jgi:hypothetical protein